MLLLLLPLLLSGCVDEIPVSREVPYGGDGKGLSVEEAKTFFESYVSGKASRSVEPEEHDNGFYIRRLMLPVGEFVPGWEEGLSTDAPSLYSVDVPVQSDFSFRVLRVDKGSGKVYQTKCWHKLVVVKDPKSGSMGCFIAFFIPDRAYALSHGGDIGRVLTNGEEMGSYSGVKVYTTLEGRRVRVNRYENGKKVEGIYIDGASDREDYIFRMLHSEKILGRVWLQRSRPRTTGLMISGTTGGTARSMMIRGLMTAGLTTATMTVIILLIRTMTILFRSVLMVGAMKPRLRQTLTLFQIREMLRLIPVRGNWVEEAVRLNRGGEGDNQQSQSPPVPFNEEEQKKVNSLLSILEKNHGINPSKYTIMKSNNCSVLARTEKSGIITLCNEFFNRPGLSDIDRLATIWHEMYHFDHKHYVTEYKSTLFKSGPLELWRMGVPSEIKDFIEKQIESELGINLEKLSGDEKKLLS